MFYAFIFGLIAFFLYRRMTSASSLIVTERQEGGTFLVTPGVGPDGLDLAGLRGHDVRPQEGRIPADPRGAGQARSRRSSESIDAAERTREEADALLAEYRARLAEARTQAEEIVERAQQERRVARARGSEWRPTRRSPSAWNRRSATSKRRPTGRSVEIRSEVADLTILATEKVTRKTLDSDDQRSWSRRPSREIDFDPSRERGPSPRWSRSPRSTHARCSRWPGRRVPWTLYASSWASSPTPCKSTATSRPVLFSP